MGNTPERLLDVSAVARRLNCGNTNVYNLIKTGKIDAVRIGPRAGLRITESSLARFIDNQRVDQDDFCQ
ncbi:MAG: helix-turn-helix domain-containing protein [Proteobacteria bacterium]|nr:helix-turn-helix domain-containing protein [Pseudomonadota bacterium]MBU4468922.1 helix-turn-helix domain-containing protein [Pseudomonadota bacterium]MCG2750915.1 helix-turn-helix domain-containing protein [Desulfobacteraceae bacterium]